MNIAEGVRRGAVAQHDERRCKTMRATRFRRAALFAERPVGTGKKVKGREIDVAPWFYTGPCASKAANHWQATAPRRVPVAPRPPLLQGRGGLATSFHNTSKSNPQISQFPNPSIHQSVNPQIPSIPNPNNQTIQTMQTIKQFPSLPHISSSDRPDRVLFNSHFDGFLSRKAFDLRSRSFRSILDLSRLIS